MAGHGKGKGSTLSFCWNQKETYPYSWTKPCPPFRKWEGKRVVPFKGFPLFRLLPKVPQRGHLRKGRVLLMPFSTEPERRHGYLTDNPGSTDSLLRLPSWREDGKPGVLESPIRPTSRPGSDRTGRPPRRPEILEDPLHTLTCRSGMVRRLVLYAQEAPRRT